MKAEDYVKTKTAMKSYCEKVLSESDRQTVLGMMDAFAESKLQTLKGRVMNMDFVRHLDGNRYVDREEVMQLITNLEE